ncbi:MAG: zinc-ribbon domain-containing protein [Bradymonadia bacterium]
MNFDCPACHTPHSFPESEIPAAGITVACTQCGVHIELGPQGVMNAPQPALGPATSQTPQTPAPGPSMDDIASTAAIPEMSPLGPGADAAIDDGTRTEAQKPVDVAPPPSAGGGPVGRLKKKKKAPAPAPSAGPDTADSAPVAAEERGFLDPEGEMEPETAPPGLNIPGFAASSDHWTWRDLPTAFMGVAEPKRVLYSAAALTVVFVAYFLLTWVGALLGGLVGILGTIFNVIAGVAAFGGITFVGAIMAYVCFQTVVEGKPSSLKAGLAWAKSNVKGVVGTPLAFLAVILAVGIVEAVVGFLGLIPFAGPILWGILSPATVVLSLAAGLVAVAAFYSLPLYVPVIYNEKTGPVETLKRLLGLFQEHGFKLVGYILLASLTITVIFLLTVIPALRISGLLTSGVGGATMGGDLTAMAMSAPGGFSLPAMMATGGTMVGGGDPGIGHTIGGIFAGIGGCLLLGLITALILLAYYTSGGIIYSIVTNRKKNS